MNIISPFEGGKFRVTSLIGMRTIGGVTQPHYGLDIVGVSSKRIIAIAAGTVARSTILNRSDTTGTWQWGNYVRVDGDDGLWYYYCHMSERLVNVGQRVNVGDVLGIEGYTGYVIPAGPGGSHLHIEMRQGAKQCAIPARVADACNVAARMGIPNATGIYTATAAQASLSDEEYIRRIVDKVGYDNPGFASWAFKQIKHDDRNHLLRKLWEALNR